MADELADTVPEPWGLQYRQRLDSVDRPEDGTECVLCGRPTGRQALMVRVVDGGVRFASPDEEADEGGDMGFFPVGSECAKRLPAGYAVVWEGER